MLADGVTEGRRIFANTLKYVLMATSSNFGNMFSAAGASLFLSFLPMLPSQILLNNLLYDVGQLAIPTDESTPRCSPARRLGHRLRATVHERVRPGQLDLRLRDLLCDAAGPARQPRPSSAAAGSSSPSPPRPWWCTSSAPGGSRSSAAARASLCSSPRHLRAHRRGLAVHPARRLPRVPAILPVSFFLILLGMIATYLPRRDRQGPLLRHPSPPVGHSPDPRSTAPPSHRPKSRPLHPSRRRTASCSWASARDLRPRSIWRDMTKSAGTMTSR